MLRLSTLAAAVALALTTTAYAQTTAIQTTTPLHESRYVSRVTPRFGTLAGSDTNLQSLVHGLRTGSSVELIGTPGTDAVTFTPTTRPMGYGNITRALDLANRELAAAGISNPTPQQLNAALNGGTITTANGTTTLNGILALRSQGMGWGKIAQTIGVHPGMGKIPTTTANTSGSVTTAAGTTTSGTVTAAGNSAASHGNSKNFEAGKGVVTAAGAGGNAAASDKGITTAGGAISAHGHGNSTAVSPGQGVVTASGATAGSGVTNAGGSQGHGNSVGRGGKP